jgi:hypothetical protein
VHYNCRITVQFPVSTNAQCNIIQGLELPLSSTRILILDDIAEYSHSSSDCHGCGGGALKAGRMSSWKHAVHTITSARAALWDATPPPSISAPHISTRDLMTLLIQHQGNYTQPKAVDTAGQPLSIGFRSSAHNQKSDGAPQSARDNDQPSSRQTAGGAACTYPCAMIMAS